MESWMGNTSAEVNSVMCPAVCGRKLCKVKADLGHWNSFHVFITCCARVLIGQTLSVMLFFPHAGCHILSYFLSLEKACKIALAGTGGSFAGGGWSASTCAIASQPGQQQGGGGSGGERCSGLSDCRTSSFHSAQRWLSTALDESFLL